MKFEHAGWWMLAVLEFVVGDIVTTLVGFGRGFEEAHPISQIVVDTGGAYGIVGVKVVFVLLMYGLYSVVPDEWAKGVPVGLFLAGMCIVTWNIFQVQLWMAFDPIADLLVQFTSLLQNKLFD